MKEGQGRKRKMNESESESEGCGVPLTMGGKTYFIGYSSFLFEF